jgi:glycine/D-amino acid oxidase-like deaminating enzyme
MYSFSMRIAIIGAGFAGLSTCWHLLNIYPHAKIKIIDRLKIGGGTSGIAAGLMHCYAGTHSKLNWNSHEAYAETMFLLEIASKAFNIPVANAQPLLRLAVDENQTVDFQECAKKHSDVAWLLPEECQKLTPSIAKNLSGLLIKKAMNVNCNLYIQGLWKACQEKGAEFVQMYIQNLVNLSMDYDLIIVAGGAEIRSLPEFASLPVKPLKGQLLELEWPASVRPLELPLNSYAYLIMKDSHTCIAGATFERNYQTLDPDIEVAYADIMPKILKMVPDLKESKVIKCHAGVRATTPDRQPLIGQLSDKIWYYTGLGSKGLLYHALFAKKLTEKISKI